MAFDIGIDLGTSSTLIYEKTKGIILNEPSMVIKSNTTSQVVAIGVDASDMMGRTPEGVSGIMPIRNGAITGFNATVSMLRHFIKKVCSNTFMRIRAVISVPCGISEVERRAVCEAARNAGIREIVLMEAPLAAAVGCGVEIGAPHGSMIVHVGAGVTEAAVISLGGIVVSQKTTTAGNTFDEAIIQYVKKQHGVVIGEATAENLKINIGSVYAGMNTEIIEVNGRDIVSGMPKAAKITSDEIRPVLTEIAEEIVDAVKVALENTPPELGADVMESGIVLTGGGSMLRGLGRLINMSTEIPVYIAENPLECVAVGTGKSIDYMMNNMGISNIGRSLLGRW